MSGARLLDDFLEMQTRGSHKSHKKLAKLVREAYPIGVPAMIMKSSTDRLGSSAGYSFHLGTPDDQLRRVASWILTMTVDNQIVVHKLISTLWKRHGREDVALAALLLANLDHENIGTDPWVTLKSCINDVEPAEALLLSIEELSRSGRPLPNKEVFFEWCKGRLVESHLALLCVHVAITKGVDIDQEIIGLISRVEIPIGDSLLSRIRDIVSSKIE
tara:strand:- start:333 stop:983 length:651 start_codon:yes stop_codon:yes gene_type:complete